ncbi:Glycosyltransferase involved in cell wall bisynthesis [Desulfacinum hydrothermale DSM 13146]|uniref:Glycosyltransferase involved in cell wall bisynthesis n=2 Tax=Desulfacinum hydrothermale TaxID=109258 RepID=A0A1W1X1G7_9BACT|nr:Glycosyltransferase involved in cell wall bisynthesis [Desulfacinum hydrothermale DSM 13146]
MPMELVPSLHIIGSRAMGGAESFFARLVNGLVEKGAPVQAVLRPQSPLPRHLASSVTVHTVAMRNGWDILSALQLRKLVEREACPIVQTYMGRATRLTRIPKGLDVVHVARLGGYYKIQGYYTHAHAWIGNTRGICDYLIASGLPAQKVHHVPNFVDTPAPIPESLRKDLRKRWKIPDEAWILFSLGRFVEKKGFDDLLKAFSLLPEKISSKRIFLAIAGDGPLKGRLFRLANQLGIEARVRWLGWQDDPGPFFSMGDIFVCPSRHEPLGNVILEAWSHGKAVVTTETVGPTEIASDGDTAILARIADPQHLASSIRKALEDEDLRRFLAESGNRQFKENYTKDAVVTQYLTLYDRLLR